jgi:hypothetical protein
MPRGIYTRKPEHQKVGRKANPNKLVEKTMCLPAEVWAETTSKFRREAILTAFRAKIK